jgi:hypothetical protein
MYVQRNIDARSRNHCYRRKEISITYSQSVFVALVIQHAKHMRRILSSVDYRVYHIFPHYIINGKGFRGKVIENKVCVLIFSKYLSETFVIPRIIKRYIIINVHRSSCQVSVIFVRFQLNLNFLSRFPKSPQQSNLMKIRPVGSRVVPSGRAFGQTDMKEQSPF